VKSSIKGVFGLQLRLHDHDQHQTVKFLRTGFVNRTMLPSYHSTQPKQVTVSISGNIRHMLRDVYTDSKVAKT
jgi:hypothetical protein